MTKLQTSVLAAWSVSERRIVLIWRSDRKHRPVTMLMWLVIDSDWSMNTPRFRTVVDGTTLALVPSWIGLLSRSCSCLLVVHHTNSVFDWLRRSLSASTLQLDLYSWPLSRAKYLDYLVCRIYMFVCLRSAQTTLDPRRLLREVSMMSDHQVTLTELQCVDIKLVKTQWVCANLGRSYYILNLAIDFSKALLQIDDRLTFYCS